MLNSIIKKINQLVKKIRQSADRFPFSSSIQPPKSPSTRALSLILTLLIISSILTGTVLFGEVIIRHSQVILGAEISEKSFFAAETAKEKACYQVFKNYQDPLSLNLSGTMEDEEQKYSVTTEIVYQTGDWIIDLDPQESFQLDMDINGVVYPSSIEIRRIGSTESDIVVYECNTGGDPRVCSSAASQYFSIIFPHPLSINYLDKYYKLRINNIGDSSETYTLIPSANLPIGIQVNAIGEYSGYERRVKVVVPKWQKYGI
ncbi:MAG: hypothetical protein PHG59_02575 [Patescibacteria group bacterium]|nr:hypothetical protein [Patescibacteria group bacterium]